MEQDSQSTKFLYDFLYIDEYKFNSLLSQFSIDGSIESVKRKLQNSNSQNDKLKSSAAVVGGEHSNNSSFSEIFEQNYDVKSKIPSIVINMLDESGFINRSIKETHVGNMVLCKGSFSFLDVAMMKKMWKPISKMMLASMQPDVKANKNKGSRALQQQAQKIKEEQISSLLDMVSILPHAIIAMLSQQDDDPIWSSLNPKNILIEPENITLTHGTSMPGEWYILGMLDAKPDDDVNTGISDLPDFLAGIQQALQSLRPTIGRPDNAYGVTPLAIFRSFKPVK